jgi:hypothetical protein
MTEATPQERDEIDRRILHAKADCALRLIDRMVGFLREDLPGLPTMKDLCGRTVSGKSNDPAAAFALAIYTEDDYAAALVAQRIALGKMLEDERKHQARPSA